MIDQWVVIWQLPGGTLCYRYFDHQSNAQAFGDRRDQDGALDVYVVPNNEYGFALVMKSLLGIIPIG